MLFDPGACCDCGSVATTCITIQWRYCNGTSATYNFPAGYTVRAVRTSDGFELASGETNAGGQTVICVPNSQTYQFILDGGEYYGTQSFPGGYTTTRTVTVTPLSEFACLFSAPTGVCTNAPYFYRRMLTLTDINGSYTFDAVSTGSITGLSHGVAEMVIPDGHGGCMLGGGAVKYGYDIARLSTGWRITRFWDTALGVYVHKPASAGCAESINSANGTFTNNICPDVFVAGDLSEMLEGVVDPIGGSVVLSS